MFYPRHHVPWGALVPTIRCPGGHFAGGGGGGGGGDSHANHDAELKCPMHLKS